jgi:hypothetical protein
MKKAWMNTLSQTLLLSSVLGMSAGLIGCQEDQNKTAPTQTASIAQQRALNLGTVQGELRLPQDQECSLFTAFRVGEEEPLFQVDVEQARVRNHQYSFLHTLPEGEYQVRGILSCDTEEGPVEYESLHDDVVIEAGQTTQVQFRFFFDVESDLNRVDLKFCADLALRSLSPAFEACPGEAIQGQYDLDWLREDCGEVGLQLHVGEEQYEGDYFSFPTADASVEGLAPQEVGSYPLTIALSSPEGGHIELYNSLLEVVECSEDGDEGNGEPAESRICDSSDMIDDLIELDFIYGDTNDLVQLIREITVSSASATLTQEEREDLHHEVELLISELDAYIFDLGHGADQEEMSIVCTFSDLDGLCGNVPRDFQTEVPSLTAILDQLVHIDLLDRSVMENLEAVDAALVLSSTARNTIGALYERFSMLSHQDYTNTTDLQILSLDLINRASEFAVHAQNDTMSEDDLQFLNVTFTHLRDEVKRIYECTACEIELDEDAESCIDEGECITIETAERASIAEEVLADVADQFNQCLEEE